jgi:hypothetical protein
MAMSGPSQKTRTVEGHEETVTNWRLIGITTLLELLFLAGLFGAWRLIPDVPRKQFAEETGQPEPLLLRPTIVAARKPAQPATPSQQVVWQSPEPAPVRTEEPVRLAAKPAKETLIPSPAPKVATLGRNESVAKDDIALQKPAGASVASRPSISPVAEAPVFKELSMRTEDYLIEQLAHVPELNVDSVKGAAQQLLEQVKKESAPQDHFYDWVKERKDLAGLPLRNKNECRLDQNTAKQMALYSQVVRRLLSEFERNAPPATNPELKGYYNQNPFRQEGRVVGLVRQSGLVERVDQDHPRLKADALRTVVQVFEGGETGLRLLLVHLLSPVVNQETTNILARRAVFDPSPIVRYEAVMALRSRSKETYRAVLLEALRHVWPPAADHAAEALVAVGDAAAIPQLVPLLDLPDPANPCRKSDGIWVAKELVQVNHLRNCLLCHCAATSRSVDLVQAPIPEYGKPLPVVYYSRSLGPAVRAEVTYLRQEFSVCRPIENAAPWPAMQRFDYVTRERILSPGEVNLLGHTPPGTEYSQKKAVLFALRELTDGDRNRTTAAQWRDWLNRRSTETASSK